MLKYISEDMIAAMHSAEPFQEDTKINHFSNTNISCCEFCLAMCKELPDGKDVIQILRDNFAKQHEFTKALVLAIVILCRSSKKEIPLEIRSFLEKNFSKQELDFLDANTKQ